MHNQTNETVLNERRPRQLRNNSTDGERMLWQYLRNRQVHGAKFRRQHALSDYIVDFVSFDAMLIVELDGGQHAEQTEYDQSRDATLDRLGFKVLRVWNNELSQNLEGVMDTIYFEVASRLKTIPTLALPLKGREPDAHRPLKGRGSNASLPSNDQESE